MAWESVNSADERVEKFINYPELNGGESFEGKFLGTVTTELGSFHKLRLATDDSLVGVSGCGMLNKQLSSVAPGSYIKITYEGKSKIEQGPNKGKFAHQTTTLIDKARSAVNSDADYTA